MLEFKGHISDVNKIMNISWRLGNCVCIMLPYSETSLSSSSYHRRRCRRRRRRRRRGLVFLFFLFFFFFFLVLQTLFHSSKVGSDIAV